MKNVKMCSFEIIKCSIFLLAIGMHLIFVLSFVFMYLTSLGRHIFPLSPCQGAVISYELSFIPDSNRNFQRFQLSEALMWNNANCAEVIHAWISHYRVKFDHSYQREKRTTDIIQNLLAYCLNCIKIVMLHYIHI